MIPAGRENTETTLAHRLIGSSRAPQGQHALQTEAVDRLRHGGPLDLPCNRAEAERVERHRGRGSQECQVAEARIELEVAHRQVALDLPLGDEPRYRGLFVAEPIDQLEIDRLAAGEDATVRDLL